MKMGLGVLELLASRKSSSASEIPCEVENHHNRKKPRKCHFLPSNSIVQVIHKAPYKTIPDHSVSFPEDKSEGIRQSVYLKLLINLALTNVSTVPNLFSSLRTSFMKPFIVTILFCVKGEGTLLWFADVVPLSASVSFVVDFAIQAHIAIILPCSQ